MGNENTEQNTVEDVITSEDVAVDEVETEAIEDESEGNAVTEDASAAENDSENEELKDEDDKPLKSKKNFNERVKQVIEQRDIARRELEELRRQVPTQGQSVGLDTEFTQPKPGAHQFADNAEYIEALVDWREDKRDFERSKEAQVAKLREVAEKTTETWNSREKEVKTEIEDYDAVVHVDALVDVNLTSPSHESARTFLTDSEYGPAVLYQLLQDNELAEKFAKANSINQVKILTKLETGIESAKSKNKVTAVKDDLKTPPKLKGGLKTTSKSMDDVLATGNFEEYMKFRKSSQKTR